jgi:hypothetical protein
MRNHHLARVSNGTAPLLPRMSSDDRHRHRYMHCSASFVVGICSFGIACMYAIQVLSLYVVEVTFMRYSATAVTGASTDFHRLAVAATLNQQHTAQRHPPNQNQPLRNSQNKASRAAAVNPGANDAIIHMDQPATLVGAVSGEGTGRNISCSTTDLSGADPNCGQKQQHHVRAKENETHAAGAYETALQRWRTTLEERPILIVGGSDGSGTRGFVDTLRDFLRVDFVVDDSHTLDVHAGGMFHGQGWPGLVEKTLGHTHSANFELDDLPDEMRALVVAEVDGFISTLKHKHLQNQLKLNQRLPHGLDGAGNKVTKDAQAAGGVSFAFKAPVALLVLPILAKVIGRPIKFIHVVRE